MARNSRKETERNLRAMAKATVEMERGIYPWPDGRKPLHLDGTPVIVKTEIVRAGGYSADNKNGNNWASWFEDPYYLRECAMERARRDMNIEEILDKAENLPLAIAQGLFLEILARLRSDPSSIPMNVMLTLAPTMHKYGLELAAKGKTLQPAKQPTQVGQFNAFTGPVLLDMNQQEREHLASSTQAASEERIANLQQRIDALQASEQEPIVVYDAVCVTEPEDRSEPS